MPIQLMAVSAMTRFWVVSEKIPFLVKRVLISSAAAILMTGSMAVMMQTEFWAKTAMTKFTAETALTMLMVDLGRI